MTKSKQITIIGAGIAGMSAASVLASEGYAVTVLEKNDKAGGRINFFKEDGFTFEMGPSWYWMPQVFEDFYQRFGYTTSDFYELKRLDPSYKVVFKNNDALLVPAQMKALEEMFENIEKDSSKGLNRFLNEAAYKYKVGMAEFVWKPGKSIFEFADLRVAKSLFKLQMFSSIAKQIDKIVADERLREILKFPVLFLGATPEDTPALYSLMNYADLRLGTWYPMGGMYNIAEAFYKIALSQGVTFKFNEPVTSFDYNKNTITAVNTATNSYSSSAVLANADYHHVDQKLVKKDLRHYSTNYWNTRKMAPSSLLVFLGVKRKLNNLKHHNLFFDADFRSHAHQIYKDPKWPDDPLFYVCCPSKTDASVAPDDMENLFLLMPLAPDLKDSVTEQEKYIELMIRRVEKHTGENFYDDIIVRKSFSVEDFKTTYNSFKGNAYGLANTLMQTALLKPSLKSKKITNLYYAGQLTTPGPGLPPSIISGQVAAAELIKDQ